MSPVDLAASASQRPGVGAGCYRERTIGVQVTAILSKAAEGGFVALNPDTGTTTQGETIEEALDNLREAVELYLEEFPIAFGDAPLVTTVTIRENA